MSEANILPEPGEGLLSAARDALIAGLMESSTLRFTQKKGEMVATTADANNKTSVLVAGHWANALEAEVSEERAAGQTMGSNFEHGIAEFIRGTFPRLTHLRPGQWAVDLIGNRGTLERFAQYEHLHLLSEATKSDPALLTVIGNAYAISPDVVVSRQPEPDRLLNEPFAVVDDQTARHADIRAENQSAQLLHAVISCKWTMRSDRAQNARSEALNLVRNRKGRTPHILVVTAEPLPSRLASLALGTGDVDCVYHLALNELEVAVAEHCDESSQELLSAMIEGKRLKDLTDLPLDLSV